MSIEKFSVEKVLSVHRWTPTLFSFTMTRPSHFKFTAGQFARIGLKVGDELVVRAYSVVSSPFDETLEFFSIVVPDGAFTSNLQHLKVGDELYLEKIPYGYLTLARYQQPLPHDLWLLATGTGLAPFCRCYKTLKLGLITRKLTWFTVFVLRLSWLMLTVFKRLLKLWGRTFRF